MDPDQKAGIPIYQGRKMCFFTTLKEALALQQASAPLWLSVAA